MTADDVSTQAYRLLQSGDLKQAIDLIEIALELSESRPRLQARLWAWRGQALLGMDQFKEAQQSVLRAMSLARRNGDTGGVESLRGLHRDVVARIAAKTPPVSTEDSELTRALIAFDSGAIEDGVSHALIAVDLAEASGSARDRVLARLALARAPEETQRAILEAHEIAQDSDDFNLVRAVAQAAKAADIELPAHVF